jgi:hypothetical protein
MKTRLLSVLVLAACLAAFPSGPAPVQGEPLAPPATTQPPPTHHVPYHPPARPAATLPEYPLPGNTQYPVAARPAGGGLPKPPGVDLDVTYIGREPLYNPYEVWYTGDMKPYLRPGTEDLQRWPAPGEVVTFTAHIMNKGTVTSGWFEFKWLIDGAQADAGVRAAPLAPGDETTITFRWPWGHTLDGDRLLGEHTVGFTVDPANVIAETCESNNSLEDRTDAISLWLAVTPELYNALEVPVDPGLPFSAEDWLQKQIAAMNAAFARSVYPSVPGGIVERVRLDRIVVATTPPDRGQADGGFHMSGDDRQGNPYYDRATDVSGALIHELSHQLGVIDLYNFGFELGTPQLVDPHGWPVQMETSLPATGLMINPGMFPLIYEEHSAHGLNANKGYRRGYYGEYMFDLPLRTRLRVLDNRGQAAPGVTVRLFQSAWGRWGTTIDDIPEFAGVTSADGTVELANRPVGGDITTRTGHTLRDNPFGIVDIIGENDEFIVELVKGPHAEYAWLHILPFNLAAWTGMAAAATLDIGSHVPPAGAPAPPPSLDGIVERGLVTLRWPGTAIPEVTGYNLYRSLRNPSFVYERIATGMTELSYTGPYDDSQRTVTYAVTAVDLDGRESGFSPLFNAFRLVNPSSAVLDGQGRRIVLDPQNGYALFVQQPGGRIFDTLGNVQYHLEFSRFLARDPLGRLIISHPGDWYDPRHSVRVADPDGYPLFEFGERGSGPGQFDNPAGVAVWGGSCTVEGPLTPDPHTLLLLHFDGSYAGADGEVSNAIGTTFAPGRYGLGASFDDGDRLMYFTAGNLNRAQGAIEFWLRPDWDGNDNTNRTFFEVGEEWFNRMKITKDGANNLRFIVWDSYGEYGVAYGIGDWHRGDWHHVAVTWTESQIALYVDGQERDRQPARPPDRLGSVIYVGSTWAGEDQANGVMDELRISDVPRVGNSDACSYRILVADSGNNRIQAFDGQGNFLASYGSYGNGRRQFNNPQGIAVTADGRVIVADTGNNRLHVLSYDGKDFDFIRLIEAGLREPIGVASYQGALIVADTGNDLVEAIIPEGNIQVVFVFPGPNDDYTGPFSRPQGVIADAQGNIVVADTGNRRVATIRGAFPPPKAFRWLPLIAK